VAISFSRPDPASPADVGAAQFEVVRRGFQQDEVRDFLRMVSAELARLQERERFLEKELRSMQTRGMSAPGVLDEETVTRLLGEETARVLSVAREAAQQMRLRASESAERSVREAAAEATRVRQEAELEVARRLEDAAADAEAEVELAKQQGRDMVEEAREYREKVLADVSRRREVARLQIEQLIHARERLAAAFDRAREAAGLVLDDLAEFDDLAGEVSEVTRSGSFFDHTKVPDAIPQERADLAEPTDTHDGEDDATEQAIDVAVEAPVAEEPSEPVVEEPRSDDEPKAEEAPADDAKAAAMAEHPSTEPERIATVVQLFGTSRREPASDDAPPPEPEPPSPPTRPASARAVDDLFARLRESGPDKVVESTPARPTAKPAPKPTAKPKRPAVEPSPSADPPRMTAERRPKADAPTQARTASGPDVFVGRELVLAPIVVSVTRTIKRVLADEENAVLTYLQGRRSVVALERILPLADEQLQAYVEPVVDQLMSAAMAGAKSVSSELKADLRTRVTKSAVLSVVNRLIDENVVQPLRERMQRCIEQCGGDREEMSNLVRNVYREWKMQRLEQHLPDVVRMAYSRGAYLTFAPGASICWRVDPNGPPCADAEDNSLAGALAVGEAFPTGHEHPVAHSGCRCLVVAHDE
jgi:DivIVA domain-containing protein